MRPVPKNIDPGYAASPDYYGGYACGWEDAERTRIDAMKGELHVWEDGKAILVITEGELREDTALFINEAFQKAEKRPHLMVFPFPVEVIREVGELHLAGVGKGVPV